ncbi:MAG TPA: NUDIX domain-containing protein [Candidatus Saccharimonadales bacterium]|nr:NUDIX domain-containing protein [Candidatus Saccharimonadales bacterium]
MEHLGVLRSADVGCLAEVPNGTVYKGRTAGRAVIFDGDRVALIHVKASGYYMLPGGGLDDDDMEAGLAREVQEEMGCHIELLRPVGIIEVYFDRWKQRQIDYCFMARKIGDGAAMDLTDFERDEGYETVWMPSLQAAIVLMEAASPEAFDGRLVRARDLLFLQTAARQAVS